VCRTSDVVALEERDIVLAEGVVWVRNACEMGRRRFG
jgi:hypothetical protein